MSDNYHGRGRAYPFHLPQYLSQNGMHTSSSGSNDSVMTQVPMSYHLPSDEGYSYSDGNKQRAWATPEIPASSGGFEDFRTATKSKSSLNPNSPSYIPPKGFGTFGQQSSALDGYMNNHSYPESYGDHRDQYQQIGSNGSQQYQQFNTGAMAFDGPVGGIMAQQYQQPYNQRYQGSSYQAYSNNSASSYGSSQMGFPGGSPARGYPSLQYNPATGMGAAALYGHNSYGASFYGTYSARNPSDMNRGPKSYRNSFSSDRNSHFEAQMSRKRSVSDFSRTSPVRLHGSPKPNNDMTPIPLGGPVQPPTTRTGSPLKMVHSSGRSSSAAPTSRTSEGAPTPGPQTRQLDLSFMSEPPPNNDPRKRELSTAQTTPVLRSRAGQSVAGLNRKGHSRADSEGSVSSVRSAKRDSTDTFTEPSLLKNLEEMKLDKRQVQAPPKMPNLTAAKQADASALSPITELTPYKSDTQPSYNDPFGPSTSMLTPWTPNSQFVLDGTSRALWTLTQGKTRKPTIDEAFDSKSFPFEEYCRRPKPDEFGVIKISNIPYNVARAEVMAFLGRNARIIDEREYEPVHIVMERVTSKTLDCYVEFLNFNEAVGAVNRFETNRNGGRGGRLGQRHVEVELSSQEALMKDLFPKAKNVIWRPQGPQIIPHDKNDPFNSGFQGFVSKEELVMLVKHVEAPQRSPFSKDCPQRPFECLISTLHKYPWYMVDYITIEDRNLLFKATKELLNLLVDRVHSHKDEVNLTSMLLKRTWRAALKCPGFTPAMKDDIVCICGIDDDTARELGMAPHASYWKVLWTIGPKKGVAEDLLMYYCALIREATEGTQEKLSLAERAARGDQRDTEPKLFGDLAKYIRYDYDCPLLYQTLAVVAKAEWTAIERVLRMALIPALSG